MYVCTCRKLHVTKCGTKLEVSKIVQQTIKSLHISTVSMNYIYIYMYILYIHVYIYNIYIYIYIYIYTSVCDSVQYKFKVHVHVYTRTCTYILLYYKSKCYDLDKFDRQLLTWDKIGYLRSACILILMEMGRLLLALACCTISAISAGCLIRAAP